MTSIKNIVKVMNFQSLIRVDKAKKQASKYFEFERDITKLLYIVANNRNLKLDKKMLVENPEGIIINIYLGNDLGFCGSFNSQVYSAVKKDKDSYKIIIGKKIFGAVLNDDKVIYKFKIEKNVFDGFLDNIKMYSDILHKEEIVIIKDDN